MTTLILKTLPVFPSKVLGSGFITVTKANGVWTIGWEPGVLAQTPFFDDVGLIAYDQANKSYSVTLTTVFARQLMNDATAAEARATLGVSISRTITGTLNEITVVNGDSVAGDPTISLPNTLVFSGKTISGGIFQNLTSLGIAGSGSGKTLRIGVGSTTGATATPDAISLGTSYSNTAGTNLKLLLIDGDIVGGLGVSLGLIDYVAPGGTGHAFYVNGSGTASMTLSSAGALSVSGGITAASFTGSLAAAIGLPITTGVSGLGAGSATFLATPTSANLRTAVTDETGTGPLVFATSPNITTPTGIVKGDVGLGNVDNTSDINKPLSTAQKGYIDGVGIEITPVTRNSGAGLALSSNTPLDFGTLTLPVGTWEVEMLVSLDLNAVTSITRFYLSFGPTANSPVAAPGTLTDALLPSAGVAPPIPFPTLYLGRKRYVVTTGTTTVHGIVNVGFTGTGVNAWGQFRAVKAIN